MPQATGPFTPAILPSSTAPRKNASHGKRREPASGYPVPGPLTRREFLAATAAAGATLLLPDALAADPEGKRTFTILHTNDLHSSLIGMGPSTKLHPAHDR